MTTDAERLLFESPLFSDTNVDAVESSAVSQEDPEAPEAPPAGASVALDFDEATVLEPDPEPKPEPEPQPKPARQKKPTASKPVRFERGFSARETAEFFDRSPQWVYWAQSNGIFVDEKGERIEPIKMGVRKSRYTLSHMKGMAASIYRRGLIDDQELDEIVTKIKDAERKTTSIR